MKKKILLVLLVIIILAGVVAGVAYAYLGTDLFKSDKQIFFSYLLDDKLLKIKPEEEKWIEYLSKKENTPYSNEGKITLNINGVDERTAREVNETNITFKGNTNKVQKLAEQEIFLNSGAGVSMPLNFKQYGDIYGIQTNLLSDKYIALKNENLKELATKLGIDSTFVEDKIEINSLIFTEEDIKTIKEKYLPILVDNLEDDLFSKEKEGKQTAVTLNMPEEKFTEVIIKILETLRDDELILNKMSEFGYDVEEMKTSIEIAIEEIKDTAKPEGRVEFKVYVENRRLRKVTFGVFEGDNNVATIEMIIDKYEMAISMYEEGKLLAEMEITERTNETDFIIEIKMNNIDETEITIKIQYNNLFNLDNIEEIIDVNVRDLANRTDVFGMNIKNAIEFKENTIEKLDEKNSLVINDLSAEELQFFILGIYQNLGLIQQ